MKIILEVDKNIPLKVGDLLVYDGEVVKTLSKDRLLRDLRNRLGDQQIEIERLKDNLDKVMKILKEITK